MPTQLDIDFPVAVREIGLLRPRGTAMLLVTVTPCEWRPQLMTSDKQTDTKAIPQTHVLWPPKTTWVNSMVVGQMLELILSY